MVEARKKRILWRIPLILAVLALALPVYAACLTRDDLKDGIVFEYDAPEDKLYHTLIALDQNYVLSATYISSQPHKDKLIIKTYQGLFKIAMWYKNSPDQIVISHSYTPAPEQLMPLNLGRLVKLGR